MKAAAAGDAASLGELSDRHAGRMKSLALRIVRAPEEAEDVVQETFVQAWRQADRFDARRETAIAEAHELEARTATNDMSTWAAKGALSDLPRDQRELLELAYWQGLSQTEIAERLSLPLGTVKTRMRTGLKKLREMLE